MALMRLAGLRFPAARSTWGWFLLLGIVGNALPFVLISWGQQRVPSSQTGILMAVNPLATLTLAHFFVAGEPMTPRRLGGFLLGFAGMVALLGPEMLLQFGGSGSDLVRQAAVLGGSLCYATNTILVRRMPSVPVLVTSAGVLAMASVVIVPTALLLSPTAELAPSPASLGAVVWLGLVPTAVCTIVYFRLIASAGPTFVSLVNYGVPLVALAAGMLAYAERPAASAFVALVLVLAGIGLAQSERVGG